MHLILMQGLQADPVQACKILQGLGFRDLGCRGLLFRVQGLYRNNARLKV